MKTPRLQRGLSMPLLVLIICIGGFFIMVGFKIIPLYAENRYIISALNSLAADPEGLHRMTTNEIRTQLRRFYTINNIRSEGAQNIEIDKQSARTLVSINYETRVPLILNIDLILSFENQLDSSQPDRCCKPLD